MTRAQQTAHEQEIADLRKALEDLVWWVENRKDSAHPGQGEITLNAKAKQAREVLAKFPKGGTACTE